MQAAIDETNRRRSIQAAYNEAHGIVPKTIIKGVRDVIDIGRGEDDKKKKGKGKGKAPTPSLAAKPESKLTAAEREKLIEQLTAEMKEAARKLEFEQAAFLRDRIKVLRG